MERPCLILGPRIICFGDVIDDVVAIPDGPIRDDTDTRSSIRFRPGGSAANTAAWLGSLGAGVDFVGVVGRDDVDRHSAALDGVVSHLRGHDTSPTGAIVVIVAGQQRTMLTARGANSYLDPSWVTDALLASAAVLHLTGHVVLNQAGGTAITALIARARAAGVTVSVDAGSAGFIADYGPAQFLTVFGEADILFPNFEEGILLTGLRSADEVVAKLGERFDTVVLTLGESGIRVAHGGVVTPLSAATAVVVDPTGAGDAFCAGYLDEWVRSRDVVAAATAGAAVAARAVALVGGRPGVGA